MPNDPLLRPNPPIRLGSTRQGLMPLLTLLALTLSLLQGCAAALVGAGVGAAVGATVVVRDRRGEDTVIDDKEIEFKSRDWPGTQNRCQVAVNSYNRLVLLTGQCRDEAAAKAYAERVSMVPKVRQVVDEITIGPFASLHRQSQDTLITSRAKLSLIHVDLKGFDPTRVTVITESGIVYLMGLVTEEEAEAVVQQVRNVSGVVKVVKIFEITDQAQTKDAQATPIPPATANPSPPEESGDNFGRSP